MIFGAGPMARKTLRHIYGFYKDVKISNIVVTKQEKNPLYVYGLKVLEIENLKRNDENVWILVCTLEKFHSEIHDALIAHGIDNFVFLESSVVDHWDDVTLLKQDKLFLTERYTDPYLKVASDICRERAFNDHQRDQFFDGVFSDINTDKVCIPRLVVVLGTKCSLRCKDCNNLMPYFITPKDLDADKITETLKIILNLSARILKCELIGGEPFLANGLEKVLKFLLLEEKVCQIEITTNGTIIPQKELFSLLQEDKVNIRISNYGKVVKQEKFIACLQDNDIRFEVLKLERWIASGDTEKRNRDTKELLKIYDSCSSALYCKTLFENRLYTCARAASLDALHLMQERDFVEISPELSEKELKEAWLRTYLWACDYCDYSIVDKQYVEPAIQVNNYKKERRNRNVDKRL